MEEYNLQKDLFRNESLSSESLGLDPKLDLNFKSIKDWHEKIGLYQAKLFKGDLLINEQGNLFNEKSETFINKLNPLTLTPLPLNFWKWPKAPHEGPAIYLVITTVDLINQNILLYIGETIAADKRWKGNHDCKNYLSNYSENLQKVGFKYKLNIRFWADVPKDTKGRQKLEQQLIRTWLPPFNKETRSRWGTTFTSQLA